MRVKVEVCTRRVEKEVFLTQPKFLHIKRWQTSGAQLPPESPLTSLLNKVRFTADYTLGMPCCAASSLSRGTHSGGTTLDKDKVSYLDESVSPEGLFGQSLEAAQTNL